MGFRVLTNVQNVKDNAAYTLNLGPEYIKWEKPYKPEKTRVSYGFDLEKTRNPGLPIFGFLETPSLKACNPSPSRYPYNVDILKPFPFPEAG